MDSKEKRIILKKLGEKIAQLKKAQKLSYRKLAAKCDLDHADIKKFESGVDIQFSTLIELGKLYRIHPRDLVDLDYQIDFTGSSEKEENDNT